jgi:hypothetical protein
VIVTRGAVLGSIFDQREKDRQNTTRIYLLANGNFQFADGANETTYDAYGNVVASLRAGSSD